MKVSKLFKEPRFHHGWGSWSTSFSEESVGWKFRYSNSSYPVVDKFIYSGLFFIKPILIYSPIYAEVPQVAHSSGILQLPFYKFL
jgi:hypothetical protein